MISKKFLTKTVKSTRARRYRIINSMEIDKKFKYAQIVMQPYFNYGLMYLYQHYGVGHLSSYFPTGMSRKYLINKMVSFARAEDKSHHHSLKKMHVNIQAIDKKLEELCVNFIKYRNGQYKARNYWSSGERKHYLKEHKCNLSGYGRISFKHSPKDFKSITLKANGNRIKMINNYILKSPYFGKIVSSQSLTYLKHKKLTEIRVVQRRPKDYELQAITKFRKKKHLTRGQANNIVGLDVNSKDDNFYQLSNRKRPISWPKNIKQRYLRADIKARNLQNYITTHNHGNDNSRRTKIAKKQLKKTKAKCKFVIDNWQMHIIHKFARLLPVLASEQLTTFTMRMSKRDKRYRLRKNTNHKLATIHPTRFRHQMECIYQDMGDLLLEVNPFDTSKACNNDGSIHNIGFLKHWFCNICKKWINRDLNAAYNIRDWSVNPKEHALWKLHLKYPKKYRIRKPEDLVIAF